LRLVLSMASTQKDGHEWPKFTSSWSSSLAKSFLSEPAPVPLPTSGALHNVLAATRKICKKDPTSRSAEKAVKARAIWVLAKVVHWLQQNPCHELLTFGNLNPDSCVWFTVLKQLMALVHEVKTNCSLSIQLDCCKQLEQAAGECVSPCPGRPISSLTRVYHQQLMHPACLKRLLLCKWLCLLMVC
jgi:hypothetical protein